jgi:hypothetical protein
MVIEGIAPAIIENVGRQCGMPMGPLEVSDSVGLDTGLKIGRQMASATGVDFDADPRDADVGSILAWGFAPYSGGCVSYMDLFWGAANFVTEADRLADQYGDRFRPNDLLREMAKKNETFYGRFGAKDKAA